MRPTTARGQTPLLRDGQLVSLEVMLCAPEMPDPIVSLPTETLGVYVHFPYCLAKCPYCDFLSVPIDAGQIPHARYANAVLRELELRTELLPALPLRSVFFGGGTPSLWSPKELGRVLTAILENFPDQRSPIEITAECNPSSFDDNVARGLREAGVNRISLGIQSLDSDRLRFLGRLHDARGALEAVERALEAGFPRVSADLIFGVSGQSAETAADEAARVAASGVTHLSAYALTIEPGTQFGEQARSGKLPLLPDDLVADSFEAVEARLESHGFRHYEVSNYARHDAEAKHNLGYWRAEPYLGLGAGAWGTLPSGATRVRYRNTPSVDRYMTLGETRGPLDLSREGAFVSVIEPLTPENRLKERLMLGLRLAEGVNLAEAELRSGASVHTPARKKKLEKWLSRGALSLRDGTLSVVKSKWLLADGIISELL